MAIFYEDIYLFFGFLRLFCFFGHFEFDFEFESDFKFDFEFDFESDFESAFESDFESDFGSDNLISSSYSMPAFSGNSFGLFH